MAAIKEEPQIFLSYQWWLKNPKSKPCSQLQSSAMAENVPLYQDRFVDICADHIRIKSYYFPFAHDKRIDIGNGGKVSFATDQELDFSKLDRKAWGMALNNVWWALDMKREFLFGGPKHLGIVITVGGDRFRKGFSVEDGETALKVLESLLPKTER